MRMFKLMLSMLLVACMFCIDVAAYDMPSVSAKYAVIIEANSGEVIAGKNEHVRASMASTTKIMTALLLCENCNLDDTAVVTKEMVTVEGSSMGLQAGDTVHYRDLLYGMMLASGNDAANSTAILIGGTLSNFAKLMNQRAKQIGMKNTNFVTPSGLDDEKHYSTAYDMALLAREALKNDDFAKAVSSKSATLEYGNPPYRRTLTNHNKMLRYHYDCNGVKTGFTKKSGRCLVTSAEREGIKIVAVTLNAPSDWEDHKTMLDYGLSLPKECVLPEPELKNVNVLGGFQAEVSVYTDEHKLSLLDGDIDRVTYTVKLAPSVFAPVDKNEIVGKVDYYLDDVLIYSGDIKTKNSVKANLTETDKGLYYWLISLIGTK